MRPIYQDTESCGFRGPTILIQYALGQEEPKIHNIWKEPVGKTLSLIEWMMEHKGGIVGFNQAHDQFHYNRTYGVLSLLPKSEPPNILDYYDCEKDDDSRDKYCVKPYSCCDLMLHGRKGEFQSTMNQKDIRIKRVPIQLAKALVEELKKRVKIPDIYFSKSKKGYRWEIVPLHDQTNKEVTPTEIAQHRNGETKLFLNKDFVNIRLRFNPSTALKVIVEKVLGYEDVFTLEDLPELPSPIEFGWWPCYGEGWVKVIREHLRAWEEPTRLLYAKNDIVYTRALHDYFGNPDPGDDDSELACAVGAMYWRGFTVDLKGVKKRYEDLIPRVTDIANRVNVNAPANVKKYLHEVCTNIEKLGIPDTSGEVLKGIQSDPEWKEANPVLVQRVEEVLEGRYLYKEIDLLEKLLKAKRLYVNFKVIGTKSNRMAGGSESFTTRGGSINPQGIKKGSIIRSLFTLGFPDMPLCGGDFDSFEVSIAEARYKDPSLRAELLRGLKFHGLMGSIFYSMSYEDIVATSEIKDTDPQGFYGRAKKTDFAWFYGAQIPKLAQSLQLPEEEVEQIFKAVATKYPGIKRAQDEEYEWFAALKQPGGLGTAVKWSNPTEYAESFLGFKRYFTMEFNVVKALFEMAGSPSDELKALGQKMKVQRRDKLQTGSGAVASALYGAAFGIQSAVQRAASNHMIQSPGGQITKNVQRRIWDVQPCGCKSWLVMPMNCHDEIESPCHPSVIEIVEKRVYQTIEEYRDRIPLISMKWKTHLDNWGKK